MAVITGGRVNVDIEGSGTVKPTSKVVTINYSEKVQGASLDNPNSVFSKGATTFDIPINFGGTQFSTAQYQQIYKEDGALATSTTTVANAFAQQMFKIDLLKMLKTKGNIPDSWSGVDLKKNLRYLKVSWKGFGTSPTGSGATFKIFQPKLNAWNAGVSTPPIPSTQELTYIQPEGIALDEIRVSDDGLLYILVHTTKASDGTTQATINTEYFSVDVRVGRGSLSVVDMEAQEKLNRIIELLSQDNSNAGTLAGKNIKDGSTIDHYSFVMDDNGYPALRIIDAAPYGYDPVKDRMETNYKAMETLIEKDEPVTIPANGSLELMFSTQVQSYKKLIISYRLANPTENNNVKVEVEQRSLSANYVIYSEEKSATAGKNGHKADFDLAIPRANAILLNNSANPISVLRYAVVGVK